MSKSTIVGTDTVYAALVTRCNANFTELYNMLTGVAASTLLTPTIASFANATHDHADDAGGGATIAPTAITVADWTNFSPGSNWTASVQCSYMTDPMGFVHLKGALTAAASAAATIATIATIAPAQVMYFPCVSTSGYASYLQINTDGELIPYVATEGTFVLFDGIVFKAA